MSMKKIIVLISVACATLFAACNKMETPTTETRPHPVTLTLSSDQIETKTTISEDDGSFTRTWKAGDKVSVIYKDAGDVARNDCFTIVSGAGTTSASFACPGSYLADGATNIRILYPYTDDDSDNDSYWHRYIEYQSYGTISDGYMGNNDLMYGSGSYSDGTLTVSSALSTQVFWLRIPAGVTLVDGLSGSNTATLTLSGMSGTELRNCIKNAKTGTTATKSGGSINLEYVSLTDGALTEDIYIACMSKGDENESISMTVLNKDDNIQSGIYTLSHTGYFYTGRVYSLQQSDLDPLIVWE